MRHRGKPKSFLLHLAALNSLLVGLFSVPIVGQIAAARQGPAEGAQMGDYRRELILEFGIGQRNGLGLNIRRQYVLNFLVH